MHGHLPQISNFNRAPLTVAVLMALGLAPAASHATPVGCPGQTSEERTSVVLDNTVDNGGSVSYSYTVCNTSNSDYGTPVSLLRDWELPFDGVGQDDGFGLNQEILANNADISNIVTPEGWSWSIEKRGVQNATTGWDGIIDWQSLGPGDPFYFDGQFADHEYVLHFYTGAFEFRFSEIDEGFSLDGFGFDSPIGPGAAPYQASWVDGLPRTGDPANPLLGGLPNTFSRTSGVPEPGVLGLFAGGLGAALAMRRRRRKGQSTKQD